MKLSTLCLLLSALAWLSGCGDDGGTPSGTAGAGAGGSLLPTAGIGGAGAAAAGIGGATAGAGGAGAGGAAAGAGGMAGGGGMGGAGGAAFVPGSPTFSAIYSEIMTKGATGNCMFAGCHGAPPDPMFNGNLTIMVGMQHQAYMNLVNVTSTSTKCMGRKLVVPNDAAGSLLALKIGDAPPCGDKMPIGKPLTAAQIKQITDWINMGALEN